jgi:hypothetical protein
MSKNDDDKSPIRERMKTPETSMPRSLAQPEGGECDGERVEEDISKSGITAERDQ